MELFYQKNGKLSEIGSFLTRGNIMLTICQMGIAGDLCPKGRNLLKTGKVAQLAETLLKGGKRNKMTNFSRRLLYTQFRY